MMTAEKLKASVLQMAMQGKLVEQRPEEGTGEDLYKEIQIEKKKMLKEGKIKKQKPLPEIKEEELPFDIPESWRWVKLGDISSYAQPKEKVGPKDITPEMWSLDLEDIEKGTGKVLNHVLASERKIQGDKVRFKRGNILYSKLRPYLLKILIADNEGITTPELVPFNIYGIKNSNFFFCFLRSPYVDNAVNSVSYGVKMPRVGTDTMINLLVPLPPLAEQKRIVARIEELMPFVEQYAAASTKLNTLNATFPEMMKKSILQEAVQGKLVPQDPNDEPASVLLKKIAEEKKRLIKEGKIKKQKPLPEITEDEIPFDIPESWEWVRLGEIGSWSSGATPSRTKTEYYGGDIPWLKTGDLNDGYINEVPERITQLAMDNSSVRLNPIGSVLMAMYGATIGKLGIANIPLTTNQACCACIPYNGIYNRYLFYYLLGMRSTFIRMGEGGAQPNISKEKIVNTIMALPPLEEQIRIVIRLDKLLPIMNELVS